MADQRKYIELNVGKGWHKDSNEHHVNIIDSFVSM